MVLVFFTDVPDKACRERVKPLLNSLEGMIKWHIDLDDIDKVLRVEATHDISNEIIDTLAQVGFTCR